MEADKQSRVFALFYTLTAVSTVIAPLGFGVIGDWSGVQAAILTSGCIVLLTIPFTFMLFRRGSKWSLRLLKLYSGQDNERHGIFLI